MYNKWLEIKLQYLELLNDKIVGMYSPLPHIWLEE